MHLNTHSVQFSKHICQHAAPRACCTVVQSVYVAVWTHVVCLQLGMTKAVNDASSMYSTP